MSCNEQVDQLNLRAATHWIQLSIILYEISHSLSVQCQAVDNLFKYPSIPI